MCRPGGDGVGPFREGLGVGVVLVLLGVVCWRVRVQGLVREGTLARPEGGGVVQAGGHPPRVLRLAFLAIGVFAAGLAALALTHTFTAPNGLGVFGGKAKLLWLCHGFPPGFATDPAWATFQPAYPPGLALLTFATYVVAGGYGDWLTQLLGVGAMAAVFGFLAVRCRFWCALVWLLAIFCAAYVLQMGTLFYAEPFAAFCVLSGWERIRDGAGRVAGWVLIGLAGAFRPEGGVILAAVWLGVRLTRGRHAAPLAGLAAGAALPLAWICGCMACGVATPGLRPFFAPDGAQALVAFVRALKLVFLNPWLTGFAWWIALVGCFKAGGYPPSVRRRGIPACPPALLSALFCLVALAATFAWRVDVDFEWLLSSSLVRLLWVPSLLLVREILDGPRSV